MGSKGNKREKESGSEEHRLRLKLAGLSLEQSGGEAWTRYGYRQLSLSSEETVGLRDWRVCHFIDFKYKKVH